MNDIEFLTDIREQIDEYMNDKLNIKDNFIYLRRIINQTYFYYGALDLTAQKINNMHSNLHAVYQKIENQAYIFIFDISKDKINYLMQIVYNCEKACFNFKLFQPNASDIKVIYQEDYYGYSIDQKLCSYYLFGLFNCLMDTYYKEYINAKS